MDNISKYTSKLIKNFIFFALVSLLSSNILAFAPKGKMQNPYGNKITLRFALSREENTKGLSGLRPTDFKNTEGMLFVYRQSAPRKFWMPDTYFNLDIIFLDKDLNVVGIEKNVPSHPGRNEPPEIFRTQTYEAHFVLETKADSTFSKKLKINDKLKFVSPLSLLEIISNTHPEL